MARSRTRRPGFQAPGGAVDRARARRRQVKPIAVTRSQTGARPERRTGLRVFVAESVGELKKVEWPGQRQLMSATAAVIVAVTVVGVFLYVADEAISRFVRNVLLNL